MRITIVLLVLLIIGCTNKTITDDVPRSKVLRDIEGYAIASCLTFQSNPYLKDQGDAWASVIIQRMKGNPGILAGVVEQIKLESKKGDMAVIRDDVIPGQDKTLPVLFCSEIIDRPGVRAAIQKTTVVLEPLYGQ